MWYVSCNEWVNKDYPKYDIKLAVSRDGKNWSQDGSTSIKLRKMREQLLDHLCYMKAENIKCGFYEKRLENIKLVMQNQIMVKIGKGMIKKQIFIQERKNWIIK